MSLKSLSYSERMLFDDLEFEEDELYAESEDDHKLEDDDEELYGLLIGFVPGEPGHPYVKHLDNFKKDEKAYAEFKDYARIALQPFQDDGKQYELVDVLLVDWSSEFDYYITFSAKQKNAPKDDDDLVKTFRAIVSHLGHQITIKDCIIKPDPVVHAS